MSCKSPAGTPAPRIARCRRTSAPGGPSSYRHHMCRSQGRRAVMTNKLGKASLDALHDSHSHVWPTSAAMRHTALSDDCEEPQCVRIRRRDCDVISDGLCGHGSQVHLLLPHSRSISECMSLGSSCTVGMPRKHRNPCSTASNTESRNTGTY